MEKFIMFKERDFIPEFTFKASLSSGKGGQHVNKVSTKIELRWSVADSQLLNEEEKKTVNQKLASRINSEGVLKIVSQAARSQLQNKQITIKKFYSLLEHALIKKKKRKATKPTAAAIEKRMTEKKNISEKKATRKKVSENL